MEKLPKPKTELGMDLMQALQLRCSVREYDSERRIDRQTLSNILWACGGVNRPDSGRRTAPFGMNMNMVRTYVVEAAGVSVYDPETHSLKTVSTEDLRATIGPNFAAGADITLLFTLDLALAGGLRDNEKTRDAFAWNGLGAMNQNIALAGIAQGIGSVVVASVNHGTVTNNKLISETETPLAIMPMGYLKE